MIREGAAATAGSLELSDRKRMKPLATILCLVGSLALGTPVSAASVVLLETPVTYDPVASVVTAVREQCHVEDLLAHRVGTVLRKRNGSGNGTIDAGTGAGDAAVLRLTITNVFGVGGGAYSGPKAITVRAELFEGKDLKRQQKVNRWSLGGFWGGFKGTCTILDRTATALAGDLGKWAFDPQYKMVDDVVPPKEDAGSAAPKQEDAGETKE